MTPLEIFLYLTGLMGMVALLNAFERHALIEIGSGIRVLACVVWPVIIFLALSVAAVASLKSDDPTTGGYDDDDDRDYY